ncbi:hypothetical protein HJG54_02765 [Leptolyngbya sp. NK1-12]|uniref:Uncharacterized protein n=1 Tax=Leptolyngbya sp. NK1-12 TaxID=2547451 RepID=A0AA96WBJ2_9CYAN|nr:hypothetical protein [Leptolyngbya sp. NK1-12]WNZ21895.1 hypothetical protein HJG54_02765 [Leptolyngbya sp. NK1-12]
MKLNGLAAVSVMVLLELAQKLGARSQKVGLWPCRWFPSRCSLSYYKPTLLKPNLPFLKVLHRQSNFQIPIHPSTVRLSRSRRSPSTPTAA